MQKILVLIFLSICSQTFAQTVFDWDQSKSVRVNGQTVPIGLSQGINSAQIQTVDLTGDGVEEWVAWDINSRQLQVFEKIGGDFRLRPDLAYLLPTEISGFLVFADFDGDGKKDLFTSTPLGIRAFRNTSSGIQVSWTIAQNFLRLEGANNIPANNLDIPLIQDVDGDGDLDLVIFNFAVGDFLEFYRNTSMERKGTPDVDGFSFPIRHWGNFEFCACAQVSFSQTCDGRPLGPNIQIDEGARILHAGGHSILYRDFTEDGVPDLLLGRDECNTLYFMPNSGSSDNPKFTSFSTEVPGFGNLPVFPRFHVGQVIEEDLIVSLNTNETSAPFRIDFAKAVVMLEKNTGVISPILQDQLFDLGENVRPYFKGNVFAGELWLTANVKNGNTVQGQAYRLSYFGDRFELLNEDYLGLSNLNLLEIQLIEYGSVKNQSYLLVSAVRTTNGVPSQVLLRSQGADWNDFQLSGLALRVGDQLTLFPYQGKDYLLVAAQNGSLTLYELDLEARSATLKTANFLGYQDNPANRNLSVSVRIQDKPDLYSADQTGRIFLVKDMMNSEVRDQVLVKMEDQNYPFRLGRNTWISVVNPGFDENVDLILGSRGGGITYLKSVKSENPTDGELLVKVYPNPTSGSFKVVSNTVAKARLITSLGQILLDEITIPANREIEIQTQALLPGVYFLQLETDDRKVLVKKVLVR
ncbi:putative secreted protein (Por secretion system target) [Algoriphagus aquaeductus]|uniref:Putative secreted protein (Por secretion system target) n=1 Tax=Algoriphagus aquaeductus TaxID=475299 RepID=A0A326RQ67_9BACT|nr:T9SS type A sorting domain-containing protein [Algoriphagus aquaeductus]PZV83429.1 putative secreted protein (Por secretion system target) [Algoriphagus aquaeductus]